MPAENRRVLAAMPHPDDMEILCAGTLLRLRDLGWEIHVATMTPGDKGSATLPPGEIAAIRRMEAQRGAEAIGHHAQHGAALAFLRLGQRRQVVSLVGDHFGEPDADSPDGRREGPWSLPRPAVRRAQDVGYPLVRLRLWRRTSGRFCHARQKNRVGRQKQDSNQSNSPAPNPP